MLIIFLLLLLVFEFCITFFNFVFVLDEQWREVVFVEITHGLLELSWTIFLQFVSSYYYFLFSFCRMSLSYFALIHNGVEDGTDYQNRK